MAERNLDLPDDLLSSKPSDQSWTPKVESSGVNGEDKMIGYDSKDPAALDSSIPLSPQWLYAKPGESKMEMRAPSSLSLGSSGDSSLKEVWRSDGSEDKKDWRKTGMETESGRRWREEERETGLLGRRDRRKTDRRVDASDNRAPSTDRWLDVGNRSTNKWSSRWGPDEIEKETRTEKRTDADKDDVQGDNQQQVHASSARVVDPDSRDKWRPRHRMEANSSGPGSFRAAPGFGLDKGRAEGTNMGFTVGRGRSAGRPSSATSVEGGVPGGVRGDGFLYPRGKLLDIYRKQKLDSSFAKTPEKMEEIPSVTQITAVEPLAFVAPDEEEEAILDDISKGKLRNSEVVDNSIRNVGSSENISDGTLPSIEGMFDPNQNTGQTADDGQRTKTRDGRNTNWDQEQRVSEMVSHLESYPLKTWSNSSHDEASNLGVADSASMGQLSAFDIGSKSSEQFWMQPLENNNSMIPEDLSLYYRDPQGEIQGPFLGVDIISWFEQGFFGADLPVRVADAPDEAPFMELGHLMPHLINAASHDYTTSNDPSPTLEKSDAPVSETGFQSNQQWQLPEFNGLSIKNEVPLQRLYDGQNFHDEEIVFPGRPRSSDSSVNFMNNQAAPVADLMEPRSHPLGLLWSELEGGSSLRNEKPPFTSGGGQHPSQRVFPDNNNGPHVTPDAWGADIYRRNALSDSNLYKDAIMDQEATDFDLSEKLRSHQIQQQLLQQHNLLNSRPHLNELMPMNPQHLTGQDLDHFMALQLQQQQQQQQQQRRMELQQQQQQQQQQLLLNQQQMLLKEQQSRQLLLEQLAQNQMRGQSVARSNNAIDQIILKHQILNELQLQQRSQCHLQNVDPTIEHLIQSKYGHPNDLLELMAHAKHGQMEHHHMLQQEQQFHGRQIPPMAAGLRHRMEMEEERRLGGGSVWPNSGGLHRSNSIGLNHLDVYQQQRLSPDELNHLERNLSLQERLQQGGVYDPSLLPFERSLSMPGGGGAPVMNFDVNSMAQKLDLNGPLHQFSSGVPSQHPLASNHFHPGNLGGMEGGWSERNNGGQMSNEWVESRIQQLHMDNGRHKREMEMRSRISEDPSVWMTNDDPSKRLLMELLHQKKPETNEMLGVESRESFNLVNQEAGINHQFGVYGPTTKSVSGQQEAGVGLEGSDRVLFPRSNSQSAAAAASNIFDQRLLKSEASENSIVHGGDTAIDHSEMANNIINIGRHPTLAAGGNKSLVGPLESFAGEAKDRVSKRSDNILLKRPPVARASSSHEGLCELASDLNFRTEGGEKQVYEGGQKDVGFRRTSSTLSDGDAASFSDMLKSNNNNNNNVKKAATDSNNNSNNAATGEVKTAKKKGKKGRQIDPALLGFKVTSNRIMMGEIQRIED